MTGVSISKFYIIDLDRTLFDTEKNADFFAQAVRQHSEETADNLLKKVEAFALLGESFGMRQFVVDALGEEKTAEIEKSYLQIASHEDLFNPGAEKFLKVLLSKPGINFGILTYGSTPGQSLKLKAGKLAEVPHIITLEKFKGEYISSWRQPDGTFLLPEAFRTRGDVTERLVLIDDKALSFEFLPKDVQGYWYRPAGSLYDGGEVTENVKAVESFDDIIASEHLVA